MNNFGCLLTEVNEKGNTVFVKERTGKSFNYFATDGTFNGLCNPRKMSKEEVIAKQRFLTNVGVSGDKIYPVTDLQDRKVLPEGYTRCEKCGTIELDEDIYLTEYGKYLCEECYYQSIHMCTECGEVVGEDNIKTVKTYDGSEIDICQECYDNGFTNFEGEEHILCKGCSDDPKNWCWVNVNRLVSVGEELVCQEYLQNNFDTCPKCGEYIFCMNTTCNSCGYSKKGN